MANPTRILLQTTIPPTEDDWHIGRFACLQDYLASLQDEAGHPLYAVTARDREEDAQGNDRVLSNLDRSQFDQLWLFAVDVGEGLTEKDCEGITRLRQQGGGLMITRDHQDLGSSLCYLGGIAAAHYFQTRNPDPDPSRHCIDDTCTTYISWPNYHSGLNGDYQQIEILDPVHPVLHNPNAPNGVIEFFPAHPHEGGIGAPASDPSARVIAKGTSKITGRDFNLVVAFEQSRDEQGNLLGRGIAQSTFHHFCDYNWDTRLGCPSFVSDPPSDRIQNTPRAIEDIHTYVRNVAQWLTPT